MGHFATALREVVHAYGRLELFRLVSSDAGACSLDNANLVRELQLHYLFGLKGTQRRSSRRPRGCSSPRPRPRPLL